MNCIDILYSLNQSENQPTDTLTFQAMLLVWLKIQIKYICFQIKTLYPKTELDYLLKPSNLKRLKEHVNGHDTLGLFQDGAHHYVCILYATHIFGLYHYVCILYATDIFGLYYCHQEIQNPQH